MMVPPKPTATSLRRRILQIHRWLSVGVMLFWLIQAITGMLIVFHWELEDATVSSVHRSTDLAAIERRLEQLAPPELGRDVVSVWTTAGLADRYDITIADAARDSREGVRIAGDGTVLRVSDKSERGFWDTLVAIHHMLLAGETGEWIVGTSGILLFSNLALGLFTAWPKRGAWRQALVPVRKGAPAARLYSWHRAIGLWAVIPALLMVGAGVLLRFGDGTASLVGARAATMKANPSTKPRPVGFAVAVEAAQAALPGSRLTNVVMPSSSDATYRIRLLAPGESRRAYGTSVIFIDANDGTVRGVFPADEAPVSRAFMDGLYAFHTGEIGGLAGRLLVLAIGAWLASMIVIGGLLWLKRRRRPLSARQLDRQLDRARS